jgi:hypothetical protein
LAETLAREYRPMSRITLEALRAKTIVPEGAARYPRPYLWLTLIRPDSTWSAKRGG